MAAELKVPTIFTAKDGFSPVVNKMIKTTQKFHSTAIRMNDAVNKSFSKLTSKLGRVGVFLGATAVYGALSYSTGVIMDFEQANADLAAVLSDRGTPDNLKLLSDEAIRLGTVTSKTAKEVVNLQEVLGRRGFEPSDIVDMTAPIISASVAMNGELDETAEMIGSIIRTYKSFTKKDASAIGDKLTLASLTSGLDFAKLQTSLPIVSGAANAAGIKFEQLLSLLGQLADAGIDPSMSANALKNIFIRSKAEGLDYMETLKLIDENTNKLTASSTFFGLRASVSGTVLADKLTELDKMTLKLTEDFKGVAAGAEQKRLSTLRGKITLLNSAYEGFMLSLDTGNGLFSRSARRVLEVVTMMLLLAAEVDLVDSKLTKHQRAIKKVAQVMLFFVKVLGLVVLGFLAFKTYILLSIAAVAVWDTALVLSSSVLLAWDLIVIYSTVLMDLFGIAVVGATWPIVLIILAIGAMIAVFYYWNTIVKYSIKIWDEFGAVLLFVSPVVYAITSLLMNLGRYWNLLKESMKGEGWLGVFKTMGAMIVDFLILPIEHLLNLLSYLPDVLGGGLADRGANVLKVSRENLFTNNTSEDSRPINQRLGNKEQRITESIENSFSKGFLNIGINNNTGFSIDTEQGGGIPIMLKSTMN